MKAGALSQAVAQAAIEKAEQEIRAIERLQPAKEERDATRVIRMLPRAAEVLRQRLAELRDRRRSVIEEVRGEGLMVGLNLKVPPADFAESALSQCLLVIPAGDNVVRLLPPLIVTEEELAEGVRRLDAACVEVEERLVVAIN